MARVGSQRHKKVEALNTLCGQNVKFPTVVAHGTYI
jgi:hypothetical protein